MKKGDNAIRSSDANTQADQVPNAFFLFPVNVRDFELDVLILRQGSEIFVPLKTQLDGDSKVFLSG